MNVRLARGKSLKSNFQLISNFSLINYLKNYHKLLYLLLFSNKLLFKNKFLEGKVICNLAKKVIRKVIYLVKKSSFSE